MTCVSFVSLNKGAACYVSFNQLAEKYVEIPVTPEVLADKLTRVGLEVEQVLYLGEGIEGVITGKVVTIERHPDSDHLWVAKWTSEKEIRFRS